MFTSAPRLCSATHQPQQALLCKRLQPGARAVGRRVVADQQFDRAARRLHLCRQSFDQGAQAGQPVVGRHRKREEGRGARGESPWPARCRCQPPGPALAQKDEGAASQCNQEGRCRIGSHRPVEPEGRDPGETKRGRDHAVGHREHHERIALVGAQQGGLGPVDVARQGNQRKHQHQVQRHHPTWQCRARQVEARENQDQERQCQRQRQQGLHQSAAKHFVKRAPVAVHDHSAIRRHLCGNPRSSHGVESSEDLEAQPHLARCHGSAGGEEQRSEQLRNHQTARPADGDTPLERPDLPPPADARKTVSVLRPHVAEEGPMAPNEPGAHRQQTCRSLEHEGVEPSTAGEGQPEGHTRGNRLGKARQRHLFDPAASFEQRHRGCLPAAVPPSEGPATTMRRCRPAASARHSS